MSALTPVLTDSLPIWNQSETKIRLVNADNVSVAHIVSAKNEWTSKKKTKRKKQKKVQATTTHRPMFSHVVFIVSAKTQEIDFYIILSDIYSHRTWMKPVIVNEQSVLTILIQTIIDMNLDGCGHILSKVSDFVQTKKWTKISEKCIKFTVEHRKEERISGWPKFQRI